MKLFYKTLLVCCTILSINARDKFNYCRHTPPKAMAGMFVARRHSNSSFLNQLRRGNGLYIATLRARQSK